MRTVKVRYGAWIPIGRLGENETTEVIFDISGWKEMFGNDGTFEVLHKRPCESNPYPCDIREEENAVIWTVKNVDVGRVGHGICNLVYKIGDRVAKTDIYETVIDMALVGGSEPPEPWEDWVERVLEAGRKAEEAKSQWENMSAEVETLPAGSDATASYADGVLSLGIPKGEKGDPGTGGASTWSEITDKPFDTIGENLKIVGRTLVVDTAPNVQQDNTKPITSAAVYTEVGNINALLALI